MKTLIYLSIALAMSLTFTACDSDYLEAEDTGALTADQATEAAGKDPDVFLKGVWSWLIEFNDHNAFGVMSANIVYDVMSEDVALPSPGSGWFYYDYQLDYRLEHWTRSNYFWSVYYTTIAKANEIISLYPNGGETAGEKGLLGQAYALRAWSYDQLIQLFQDYMGDGYVINREAPGVPIIYNAADGKTEEEMTAAKGRNTVGDVVDFATSDFEKAIELLSAGYVRPSGSAGKNYIDLSVAQGLAARHYLLLGEWQKAADAAAAARAGYAQRNQKALFDGFMDVTASDVMWGYDHNSESATAFASYHSHMSNLNAGYAGLNSPAMCIDARLYSYIPADDYRKELFLGQYGWTDTKTVTVTQADADAGKEYVLVNQQDDGSYEFEKVAAADVVGTTFDNVRSNPSAGSAVAYANLKFGANGAQWADMDYIYMRAAEMVLIEAEAYARLDNNAQAAIVLAELMTNRQPGWSATSVTLEEILLQRRIELWGEGFAFHDMKRNNLGINRQYEGSNHLKDALSFCNYPAHHERFTYQLPLREIQENDQISEEEQNK